MHRNSGVPNHGYALLVDGGTFNGHAVAAIGMTKAAHIYWRAQTAYQTPASDFADHADALEASCRDLVGASLMGLSTDAPAGPSGQTITAADCTSVTEMAAAVELRTSPDEQCNFQPLLQPGSPALCGAEKKPKRVFHADFEKKNKPLEHWTLSNQGRYAGWPGTDWQGQGSLPGDRAGTAAFAADPDAGNCDQGAGDVSGVMTMTSKEIHLPGGKNHTPRLTFEHYVATENGFDGGNVKISVNGGAFELLPASAFVFNPYNAVLVTEAAGNTNPLAGQPGFTGTDGGKLGGSWGQSQVDLTTIGVKPHDKIRIALRLRHRRLRRHRRLVRRQRRGPDVRHEEGAGSTARKRRGFGALSLTCRGAAERSAAPPAPCSLGALFGERDRVHPLGRGNREDGRVGRGDPMSVGGDGKQRAVGERQRALARVVVACSQLTRERAVPVGEARAPSARRRSRVRPPEPGHS